MKLERLVAPTVYPLTVAEARQYCGRTDNDRDPFILGLIAVSTDFLDGVEGYLGRCLITQTWRLSLRSFPFGGVRLPLPPLQSVEAVRYLDTDGLQQTLAAESYNLEAGVLAPVAGTAWPSSLARRDDAVSIDFVAGYGKPSDVPEAIRAAIGFHVAHMETNESGDVPAKVFGLVRGFRILP